MTSNPVNSQLLKFVCFFPTCQVRVVRFYVCSPSPPCPPPSSPSSPPSPSSSSSSSPPSFSPSSWTDFNMELQIAVCSTGPHRGSPKCSVQRRTLPGSSRADRAAPDLTRGATERTVQHRTSPGELPSGPCSTGPQLPEDMSKDMSEKNARKNVRRNLRRYVNRNVR